MTKVLYKFNNIDENINSLFSAHESIDSAISVINNINIDNDQISPTLNSVKKSTTNLIENIKDLLNTNTYLLNDITFDHKIFEQEYELFKIICAPASKRC